MAKNDDIAVLKGKLAQLERDLAQARAERNIANVELAEAAIVIRDLRLARDHAINRVDWAIDTINTVLDTIH